MADGSVTIWRPRRWYRRRSMQTIALAVLIGFGVGSVIAEHRPLARLASPADAESAQVARFAEAPGSRRASFGTCGFGSRSDYVVDGDTFELGGRPDPHSWEENTQWQVRRRCGQAPGWKDFAFGYFYANADRNGAMTTSADGWPYSYLGYDNWMLQHILPTLRPLEGSPVTLAERALAVRLPESLPVREFEKRLHHRMRNAALNP